MKFCKACNTEKLEEEFNKKGTGHQAKCRTCQHAYHKAFYQENCEREKKRLLGHKKARKIKLSLFINKLKSNPCTDCGNTFPPICMDFDHLRDKSFNIGEVYARLTSEKTILEEIAKCELVCANCHRIRTQNRSKVG